MYNRSQFAAKLIGKNLITATVSCTLTESYSYLIELIRVMLN